MKKFLAIMTAALMVLVLLPASVFAATVVNVNGSYTSVASNTIYRGNNGTDTLKDQVTVSLTGDLVLDGSTFENGAELYVNAAGHNVTIKNCTFTDTSGTYEYACSIYNAAAVVLENNTVNGSWRGFNVVAQTVPTTLNAIGNNITLTPLTGTLIEKNVGIQLGGPGWTAAGITISGNTFAKANMAIRLHYGFAFASGHANDVIVLGKNTVNECASFVGYDIGDGSPTEPDTHRDELGAIVANINTIATLGSADTEVTANAGITYTVIIPASVDFGTIYKSMPEQSKAFPITVQDALLEEGKKITVVNATATMAMKDNNGAGSNSLAFALSQNTFDFTADGTANATVSCTPADLQKAGSYKGTMTFSVSYLPAA
ncbi:MAG TPA: hypothetical protein PK854_10020 [Oscillospiraceae bacterium]|nr:hypothetical protein [Oscillospiraceae bacterium]HPS35589.1 hypothetical protein [Oscillospiraceae bacterium]